MFNSVHNRRKSGVCKLMFGTLSVYSMNKPVELFPEGQQHAEETGNVRCTPRRFSGTRDVSTYSSSRFAKIVRTVYVRKRKSKRLVEGSVG